MSLLIEDDFVHSVHVISTGSGKQHEEHRYGSWKPSLWWIFASQKWIEIPINVFLIEHEDGLVLFDAGMDSKVATNPDYVSSAIVRLFLRNLFRFRIGSKDTLTEKISELGYNAKDVKKAVISHLHFDHIGCIKEIPQAELLVSSDEWLQLSGPHPERDFILREHIVIPGAKWRQIDFQPTDDPLLEPFGGCYDVMGDGSMVLLPTPGHTPGSMSMLVRTGTSAPLLMVGDLTYEMDLLMNDQLPGTGNETLLRSSYAKVRDLKNQLPDLIILPAHDPAALNALNTSYNFADKPAKDSLEASLNIIS